MKRPGWIYNNKEPLF